MNQKNKSKEIDFSKFKSENCEYASGANLYLMGRVVPYSACGKCDMDCFGSDEKCGVGPPKYTN